VRVVSFVGRLRRNAITANAPAARPSRSNHMRSHQSAANDPSRSGDMLQMPDGDSADDESRSQYDNSSTQSGASDRLIKFPLGRRPSRSEENTIRHRR
jgi:hypothetical protein